MAGGVVVLSEQLRASRGPTDHSEKSLPIRQVRVSTTGRAELAILCGLGATGGVSIACWMVVFDDPRAFFLTGLAHSIALCGMLRFAAIPMRSRLLYLGICALFPAWGMYIGMCGMHTFSPLVCSAVWGCMLWHLLGDRVALIAMTLLGSIPALPLIVFPFPGRVIPSWYFPAEIAVWHTGAALIVAWLGVRYRFKQMRASGVICKECSYPRDGLASDAPCPECGSPITIS